jgi:hypothetical protein
MSVNCNSISATAVKGAQFAGTWMHIFVHKMRPKEILVKCR